MCLCRSCFIGSIFLSWKKINFTEASHRCEIPQPLRTLRLHIVDYKDHPVYSDFFNSKQKCKVEGYQFVCAQCVALSCCLSTTTEGKQQAVQGARCCLQKKARGLTTPRSSKPPCPGCVNHIEAEIKVSLRWALR